MPTELLTNTKPIEEYVKSIREHVQSSTDSWRKIAECFAEAREMYGSDSDSFKRLCKETKFSNSKASKLATIATSERLKDYYEKLSAVHSWGTLYAISVLEDEKFEELKKQFKLDDEIAAVPFITQADVDRIRVGKRTSSFFKNYAVIQIDEDALRGELLSGEDLERLRKLTDDIEAISKYVRVKLTDIDDKETSKLMARLNDKAKQIARRRLAMAYDAMLAQYKKQKAETDKDFQVRVFGQSRSEFLADFDADEKAAFEKIGVEYDHAAFFGEAQAELGKATDKFIKKVLSRSPKPSIADDVRPNEEKQAA